MDWLFVGSSSSVVRTLPQARVDFPSAVLITANAGLLLVPVPDYYFAADQVASVRFEERAREAQRQGTKLVTVWREKLKTREERRVVHYDQFLRLSDHDPPTRDKWGCFRYSGPTCMEYALRHGATRIVLVGCDGYSETGDYFHAEWPVKKTTNTNQHEINNREVVQKRTQELVDCWPEVEWIVYGDPRYDIHGNWKVRRHEANSDPISWRLEGVPPQEREEAAR